jgi:hypothetical protein
VLFPGETIAADSIPPDGFVKAMVDVLTKFSNVPEVLFVPLVWSVGPVAGEIDWHPFTLPFAAIPVGALPLEHCVGVAAKASAVPA